MGMNQFDRLSDDLLRLIFNRVVDANSLGSCLCVSKRFASVVPQTKAVSLVIPRFKHVVSSVIPSLKQSDKYASSSSSSSSSSKINGSGGKILKKLMKKFITKPLRSLHNHIRSSNNVCINNNNNNNSSSAISTDWFYSVDQVLKSFNNDEIESLQIILTPSRGLGKVTFRPDRRGFHSSPLLKWKAVFGSELKSCVILVATSFKKNKNYIEEEEEEDEEEEEEESTHLMATLGVLKDASAMHSSLKQIGIVANGGPMLGRIEVVTEDDKKQGRLCMNQQQIVELRSSLSSTASSALSFKLRSVPVLELPAMGKVMKGATLVVVRAVDDDYFDDDSDMINIERMLNDDNDLLEGAFDGDKEEEVLNEAVKEILKKNTTFSFELNSFDRSLLI